MKTIVIFDTETTGLPKPSVISAEGQPKIIELGAIKVSPSGEEIETLSLLFNPKEKLEEKITKITGLTDEDLRDKPTFAESLPEIRRFFEGVGEAVAHNAQFDKSMLIWELERAACNDFPLPDRFTCSANEYQFLFGYVPSLAHLYKHSTGEELAQTHRALDDAFALLEVLRREDFFHVAA